jgi:hypothetical protein
MATASTKVLSEALKLSVQERVRVAEKLLESADAEGYEDESEGSDPRSVGRRDEASRVRDRHRRNTVTRHSLRRVRDHASPSSTLRSSIVSNRRRPKIVLARSQAMACGTQVARRWGMKHTKRLKRLKLAKESIRVLTDFHLGDINGGDVSTSRLNTSSMCTYTNNSCQAQTCWPLDCI